ncbi:MAG TPA: tyrosine--tRNA ligase [Bacteroidales bacterium]|nr:tyrosine--tRNA ligase [Bacteroidales bacterium]OQA90868.1 MAG: Tyrosine--tRNA ligase [Bacteroidetes bacterium ADurb.Bin234]HOS16675.1 tyrosine--tRNA ligase [Bacteroidales bacterium]
MNFVDELKWRGMIHDIMPGTDELLQKEYVSAYVGIDPTADSLHIGHLVSVMLLKHLQRAGHKPLALVGGATGLIGDPSFKSEERQLLTIEQINHNLHGIKNQLSKFLDFNHKDNAAELLNNYDWMKDYGFLEFIRDIGKHISVNYMMAKDSVKKRMETGLSFTEFAYQLLQGYDFLYLYQHKNCRLQMGGSDQWGNITTGTELIRRVCGGEAFALTCPLITKSDGGKFGKTEKGNIWLDPLKTSPYAFLQFWLNCSDEDSKKFIRIFTLKSQEEIKQLEEEHDKAPHLRLLQKALAKDVTIFVHSESDYQAACDASDILFGKGTKASLAALSKNVFLSVFEGVPTYNVAMSLFQSGISVVDVLTEHAGIFASKGEVRRLMKEGGLFVNKEKISDDMLLTSDHLINNNYVLVQKGKKNYFLINVH